MPSIHYLLFDLDDTLYTDASGLFTEVGARIEAWTARALGLTAEGAATLRRRYFAEYGTTMAGLLRHHPEADIDDYLEYVHQIDVARYLRPNPALDAMLGRLDATKVIFTNGIASWAERILTQLGVRSHFAQIIDVRAVRLQGKPRPFAYEQALALLDTTGPACALIDDQPRNLQGALPFGMRTVLVRPNGTAADGIEFAVEDVLAAEPVLQALLGE